MAAFPVLLMTGLDLYRLVDDVLEGRADKEAVVDLLYTRRGLFERPVP
jgi:hypothetical protein